MRYARLVFVSLSLFCCIASCSKENAAAGDMPLVQRINGTSGDSTGAWEFAYDSAQHLQSIRFENNNGHKWIMSISGRKNDTAIVSRLAWQSGAVEMASADTLVYSNDKVAKKLSRYYSHVYVYDMLGRLAADSVSYRPSARCKHTIAHDFLYDEDNNVLLMHTYHNSAGIIAASETMNALYSSNENPYYKPGLLFYILCGADLALSLHNRTTAKYESPAYPLRTEQYAYSYNSGFLINMSIRSTGANVSTYDFYY
jgi:hypothetical protein